MLSWEKKNFPHPHVSTNLTKAVTKAWTPCSSNSKLVKSAGHFFRSSSQKNCSNFTTPSKRLLLKSERLRCDLIPMKALAKFPGKKRSMTAWRVSRWATDDASLPWVSGRDAFGQWRRILGSMTLPRYVVGHTCCPFWWNMAPTTSTSVAITVHPCTTWMQSVSTPSCLKKSVLVILIFSSKKN